MKRSVLISLVGVLLTAPWSGAGAEAQHDFGRWETEIAAFEAADRVSPPPKGALLFIGSSTIRRWETLARDFPDQRVINRGFDGSEIVDATHFAARVIFPCEPRAVFLRAGGNDLNNGKTPEQVLADFKEFAATVRARLPRTEIVFISLSPSISRWKQKDAEKATNTLIAKYVRRMSRMKYIETYDIVLGADGQPRPELFVEDQLHLNAAGYRLLVKRVRRRLPK